MRSGLAFRTCFRRLLVSKSTAVITQTVVLMRLPISTPVLPCCRSQHEFRCDQSCFSFSFIPLFSLPFYTTILRSKEKKAQTFCEFSDVLSDIHLKCLHALFFQWAKKRDSNGQDSSHSWRISSNGIILLNILWSKHLTGDGRISTFFNDFPLPHLQGRVLLRPPGQRNPDWVSDRVLSGTPLLSSRLLASTSSSSIEN